MKIQNIIIYLIILITIDAIVNLTVLLIQSSPGEMILTSMVIRPFSIAIVYSLGILIASLFQVESKMIIIGFGAVFSYLMVPIIVFFLKSNTKSLIETIIDIHSNWFLFSVIYFPFIIAVGINLLLFKRLHKWQGD